MNEHYTFQKWFIENWSRAGLLSAVMLLVLSPFFYEMLGLAEFLIFLQLPVYLVHQYEEHAHGKFKVFANQMFGDGKEILDDVAILWIDVVVWIVDILALYLAHYLSPVWGFIAVYLTVVNGMLHILGGIALRNCYPGFWSSLFLFLPVGGYSLYVLSQLKDSTLWWHGIGIVFAIGMHGILLVRIRNRKAA